jgi:hypothetical protein
LAFLQEFVLADHTKQDLNRFNCGKPEMNIFLSHFAIKNMRLNLSHTWVLPNASENQTHQKTQIAAYYTLASSTVMREEIPSGKRLPGYPVPIVLLARLALDKQFQGDRLGEKTLISALQKSVELTAAGLPALGVTLDVLDKDALRFYQHYELFESFSDDPMRLFVSMHVLKQI